MTAMIMHSPSLGLPTVSGSGFWRNSLAAGLAVALHAVVAALLVLGWTVEKPAVEAPRVLRTQLVMLPPLPVPEAPAPTAVAEVAPQPVEAAPAPVQAPRPPPSKPVVDPRLQAQKLEQATLARKRVEEQKREQQAQQQAERQRERQEHQRRQQEAEQQAAERQRQAAQQAQALARQRQAEQTRLAAADSRHYQPLSKEAPDYPQRALDKGLEGDCTVEYSVKPDGRIDNPKVLDGCHPLFIRPSLTAAKTFRYQPRIIDGQAVTVPAVRNTFHYRIE
ncbi:energy transducer TonB [Pseudomonas fluorescens]|uniref:Protein TonB n=1 Tax=Pseudomonas fluorescens TaxID=294 RepID=A0A944HD28_PSEFL|nr:energy transducer TonB [Pseudomonas fluorescens]MBT2298566.1 TonB family protein [Pseudomonas fluorescens]MBT2310091.1 TonB family protein [Pseudomonas fluorescens]MBT2311115.1 TonB family protein [Pseudomonas fluorescens]MBT2319950.1 TonB family protein [Pseudomonas fluorescens]MBT2329022.1 TonB family protein [Pseudomonas fluorescens]